MELHIGGLDPNTTSKSLKQYLKNKLKPLGVVAFDCQKPKGKRYGFITLPHKAPAEKFLAAYGQRGALYFSGHLTVGRGNRIPDVRTIEGLRRRERDVTENEISSVPDVVGKRQLAFTQWSCGILGFDESQLTYHTQYTNACPGLLMFGKKALTLSSPPYNPNSTSQTTKIEIRYASVEKILVEGANSQILTLSLYHLPKITHLPRKRQPGDLLDQLKILSLAETDKPLRVRGVDSEHESVVQFCLTYRLEMNPQFSEGFSISLKRNTDLPTPVRFPLRLKAKSNFQGGCEVSFERFRSLLAIDSRLDFPTKFQLQRLAQNGYFTVDLVRELYEAICKLPEHPHMAQALRRLARETPEPGPDSDPADYSVTGLISYIMGYLESGHLDITHVIAQRHEHLHLVHQAVVTPGGIYLEGPELCPANRVLRKYHESALHHFLRVKFQDEDGDTVRFDRINSLESIYHSWFRATVLDGGIQIAGKLFSFLGFSNSSLQDHACWFLAPLWFERKLLDSWDVVKRLGDFSHIRSPAKCAARIGQAFSDTNGGAVSTAKANVVQLPDVENLGRVFSDGCGTVSLELLRKIWKTYRRKCRPTCFQIRYAGAKGMISLDKRLSGEVLCIRPSMLKFESQDNNIEICDASKRALPFFLNRQIVKILEDLGVSDESFLRLQASDISYLKANASSPTKAADFLERFDIGSSFGLSQFIRKLDELGISFFDDSFLRSCVEHAVLTRLRMIKHKARIYVEKAYTLFGIMDETNELLEGQIVCRVDGRSVTGTAAVTRSPALHPGDVQVVAAVEVSRQSPLEHLNNCVIFSQRGARDLPSKLSGGDLDGDLFNVIFDPSLIPPKVSTPADYPLARPVDMYREMKHPDITNWFIQFMQNDQLSRIALAHLQLADFKPGGTLDRDCLQLAEMHSTAVDFQKTGVPVNMLKMPRMPKVRPDFMAPNPRMLIEGSIDGLGRLVEEDFVPSDDDEGPDSLMRPDSERKPSLFYPSQKALGQLYRAVNEQKFLEDFEAQIRRYEPSGVTRRVFEYVKYETQGIQWDHLVGWAWEVRQEYEEHVIDNMVTHSPNPRRGLLEVEVFTGDILGKGGSLPSRRVKAESRNMKENFGSAVAYIVKRIVHGNPEAIPDESIAAEFDPSANWADTSYLRDQALERSIACLHVSMQQGEFYHSGNRGAKVNRRLESFQYVAGMVALRECEIFKRRNAKSFLGFDIMSLKSDDD